MKKVVKGAVQMILGYCHVANVLSGWVWIPPNCNNLFGLVSGSRLLTYERTDTKKLGVEGALAFPMFQAAGHAVFVVLNKRPRFAIVRLPENNVVWMFFGGPLLVPVKKCCLQFYGRHADF